MPDATHRAVASASVRGSLVVGSGLVVADEVGAGVAGSSAAGLCVATGISGSEPADASADPPVDASSIGSGPGPAPVATRDGVAEIAAGAGDGVARSSI
jgi:hypothetical protein